MSPAPNTILLVDDEPFEGRLLLTRLEDERAAHLRLCQATSLDEGIAAVREAAPDVILLDYTLRPHHFEESLAALRSAGYAGPVVLYTQLDHRIVQERGLDALADAYLPKEDATAERLLALVERLIR
jgi:DNA-binding response OmpR family regulator